MYLLCVLHALLEAGARAGEPRLRLRLQFQELAVFGVELAGTGFFSSLAAVYLKADNLGKEDSRLRLPRQTPI